MNEKYDQVVLKHESLPIIHKCQNDGIQDFQFRGYIFYPIFHNSATLWL